MTIAGICKSIAEEYPDLFTEKEIRVAMLKFTRLIQRDIQKGKVKHYPDFGTTILTSQGQANSKQKMANFIEMKEGWFNKWKKQPKNQNWKKQRIDIYWDFC